MSSTSTLSDLARLHREGFVRTLEGLAPDDWLVPSLCTGWRVVDVAAHLAWAPVTGAREGVVAMVRSGFSMNRMIARSAVGWSSRGREAILDQLRDNARTGARPVGMPPVAAAFSIPLASISRRAGRRAIAMAPACGARSARAASPGSRASSASGPPAGAGRIRPRLG